MTDATPPIPRTPERGLTIAVAAAGTSAALARLCGVSAPTAFNWKRLPWHHARTVEEKLGVPRWLTRPDIWDPPPDVTVPPYVKCSTDMEAAS